MQKIIFNRWLIYVAALGAVTMAAISPRQAAPADWESQRPGVHKELIGTWRLISRETLSADGKRVSGEHSLGEQPLGYLVYDATGHVSAQLMRSGRSSSEMEQCVALYAAGGNNSSALCGYDAYFGTYSFDGPNVVVHHLELALFPQDVGKNLRRSFAVDGDQLTIALSTTSPTGEPQRRILVWDRVR